MEMKSSRTPQAKPAPTAGSTVMYVMALVYTATVISVNATTCKDDRIVNFDSERKVSHFAMLKNLSYKFLDPDPYAYRFQK